ncbi:MAG TPA: hypothetical protein IAB03_09360 [Candidatus Gallibacteroides avistercoris]|uniref:Uncharacterized protein n=1 Tax=Candidatus Gallibacteroides avistercoris TaxID=2840833 RepID=A0A9D1M9F1_9BACT|nr:hypothetical protein [Candidatus Gallibacteroides avistercoris]
MKKYNLIPGLLLIYLIVMAGFGWEKFAAEGKYLEYFGIIGGTLIIIFVLRIVLKRKNKFREETRKRREASGRRFLRDDQIL